ncbi:uncharacterized protein CANTADRAFT_52201 [Suhomyces tanzawaensis NRRL Y-17324]|uniref:Origin recognition complex subunit 4 n=1 Tax=Suhomyces tanzawaensis NRRL Y-17324 TaxID=984487 RepID=A0A1E4SI00_9ASCO|nr:uncharacterized protein CANTADRAFT_52201 [Suhomyces tanzawaensis NRRL Y-17324]ODV79138.1 hypothetical protein CANTADRAFT_52201 [Suhomyces tanzawaensis NRRL Y-17324]
MGNFNNILESKSLKDKYIEIHKLLEHTIRDNEGHSIMIIGPRSSGKTSLVNAALADMETKYGGQYIVFKLNAFIHSDDNSALREIAKQLDNNLNRNMDQNTVTDELQTFEQRSISDTMNIILNTLNKRNEEKPLLTGRLQSEENPEEKLSLIFIIEEFEKFTDNNKQTLLYNLFDSSQNSSVPICVVGISSKIITRELLEKRVRSRFSQRMISINKPNTLEEFWANARLALTLNDNKIEELTDKAFGREWNSHVDHLFHSSTVFKRMLYQNYYTVKNYKDFNNACIFPMSKITTESPFLQDKHFQKYIQNQSTNHTQELVKSLSSLELLLTIAAARWVEKHDLQVINFNLAYKEYEDMMKGFNVNSTSTVASANNFDSKVITNIKINQKIWSANVLKNNWEILYKLGLLLDSTGLTTNNDGHIITNINLNKNLIIEENKMVQLDVSLDELGNLIDDLNVYKKLTRL